MCLTEIKKTKYNISEALSPHFGVLGFMFACHLQQGGLTSQSSLLQLLQVIQLSDRITFRLSVRVRPALIKPSLSIKVLSLN